MLDGFSTAQVALLLVALQFAVMTFGWLIAAQLLPGDRRPASWWAGYAACSAVGLTLIVVGMQAPDEPKRALGNLLMIAATVCLQRGVWAFGARAPANAVQVMVLLVVAVVATMGMSPHWAPLRIGVGSTLWAALYVWVGVEVFAITRRDLRLPYAALCALPMMLTAVMLSLRAWRAAISPATVLAEVNNDTALNLGSSVSGLVMALVLSLGEFNVTFLLATPARGTFPTALYLTYTNNSFPVAAAATAIFLGTLLPLVLLASRLGRGGSERPAQGA